MMTHGSIRTFLRHYLPRRVTVDTPAVVRGIKLQDALMRAACTLNRSIDPHQPGRLIPEQSSLVNNDPTILPLLNQRKRFKCSLKNATKHPKYAALTRKINNERAASATCPPPRYQKNAGSINTLCAMLSGSLKALEIKRKPRRY